jgi:hypothetical protein
MQDWAGSRILKVERPRPVYRGKTGYQRKLPEIEWSPGQESNLDLTLRRRVHCPLCYREASAARGLPAASPRSIRAGLRASRRRRLLNKRAGQPGALLAPFKADAVGVIHTLCG